MTNTKEVTCPNCEKKDTWNDKNEFKPFCSERCKLIDLGEWASEGYRVSSDEQPSSDDGQES